MDCLRSANFRFSINSNISAIAGAQNNFWTDAQGINHVTSSFNTAAPTNYIVPQGFKNINLYGFKITGNIFSGLGPAITNLGIINDYFYSIACNGQDPLFSANINLAGPPVNNTTQNINYWQLTRYQNEIMFSSPIQSVTNLGIISCGFTASNLSNPTDLFIQIGAILTIYYRFEGE